MNVYFIIVSTIINICLIIIISVPIYKTISYKIGLNDRRPRDDEWAIRAWGKSLSMTVDSCDIVFLGDSFTYQGNFAEYFPTSKVVCLGYPGDDLLGVAYRTEHLSTIKPHKVFIMVGVNGSKFLSLKAFERRYSFMLDSAIKNAPNSNIYVQSLLPHRNFKKEYAPNIKIKKMNEIIKNLCFKKGLVYINLYDLYLKGDEIDKVVTKDGIHLVQQAYVRWINEIKQYIEL